MLELQIDWKKWNKARRRERWARFAVAVKLFVYKFTCDHWWKAISPEFDSPYFMIRGGDPVSYRVEQCKKCGNTKIVRDN